MANWNILQPLDVAGAVDRGFDQWQKSRREHKRNEAIDAYSASPDDPQAWAAMVKADPAVAIKLSEVNDRRAFNNAMTDYLSGSGMNALTRMPRPETASPGAGPLNALMPRAAQPMAQATPPMQQESPLPIQGGQPAMPQAAMPQAADDGLGELRSAIGEPQDGRDRAFLAMVKRDPIKALKLQGTLRDNFVGRLKAEHSFYTLAVEELSRVQDDAGWQAALQRLAPYAQALDVDLTEKVPGNYPGPDQVEEMMQEALPIKQRLSFLLSKSNVEADNARADRNTDSMVADRDARRAEDRRYHNVQDASRRRGQDIRSGDTRRGQDIRGTSPRLKSKRAVRPTATGPKGEKVEWNGKAWVPLQ